MNEENALSRRLFLQKLGLLGAAGVGAGALLSACGGGDEGADTGMDEDADAGDDMADAGDGFSCMDTTGLTEAELTTRQNAEYVDDSPFDDKLCNNCQFWLPDAPEIEGPCGGCQVIKGPIHPAGYCNLWVAKAS